MRDSHHQFLGLQKKSLHTRALLLLVATLTCVTSNADDQILDYFFDEIKLSDEASKRNFNRLKAQLDGGSSERAIELAEELVNDNEAYAQTHPIRFGKLLGNLGMLLSDSGQYVDGLASLDVALDMIELRANPYSSTVQKVTLARGITQLNLNDFEQAEESFRRAQHIAHRTSGVYTPNQLEIIHYLTRLKLSQGKYMDADQEQEFNLRISEQAYGKDSEEIVPVLLNLGAYFASRGDMLPLNSSPDFRYYRDSLFRQSFSLYNRSIDIIEANHGVSDLRLVQPLRGLARARLLQNTNRGASEDALERALSIVEGNPDTDVPDRVMAMIHLADMYTITGDVRAKKIYIRAWDAMQLDETQARLSAEIFGTPTRLYPEAAGILYLARRPDAALDGAVELYIDVAYSIRADGKVNDIRMIDKNVPNSQVRFMRSQLAATRFRPRIMDGELVPTKDLMIHQTYQVVGEANNVNTDIDLDQIGRKTWLVPENKLPQLTR